MVSIRQLAGCLGLPSDFSIVGDFFGYASPPPWTNANSQANLPQQLSVLTQAKRVQQKHVHLDLIRVGTDGNGLLLPADEENLDCAVQWARDILAPIGLGIGRVNRWWNIPLSDGTGYEAIGDDCEACDLVDEYTAPSGGIDVFFVDTYVGNTVGLAPAKGDGVVVESRANNFLGTARTFTHELGHYLGLGHEQAKPNNLMCQTQFANPMPASIQLDQSQTDTILDHSDVRPPC